MKFGMIGTNFVSGFFMDGAKQVVDCEVVAVCDVSLDAAEAFAAKHNIPHAFASFEAMAEAQIIEAVYIAVPNGLHKKIAMYFLERNIPTFCEKPLASNAQEVEEIIACAKQHQTYLQEGLIPLYNPNFKILKEALSMVGPIHQVTLNFSKYSSRYDAYLAGENPTTFRSDLANGAIMDLGVYVFADCIGLWGKPQQILSAASLLDTGADVSGTSIFIYEDFNVSLSYSKASDTKNFSEICGEKGILRIDQLSQPQKITFFNRLTKTEMNLEVPVKENFFYEISEMIERVQGGYIESLSVPFAVSKVVHETLSDCRKQAGIVFPADRVK